MDRTRIFVVEDNPTLLRNLTRVLVTYPELELVGEEMDGARAVDAVRAAAGMP